MSAKESRTEAKVNGTVMRTDTPHATMKNCPKTVEPVPVKLAMAAAGQSAEQSADQLEAQAGQLASYLQERQRDVDGREAQLNARVAQLENELRTARLWVRERDHEFSEREQVLQQRIADLEARLQALSSSELTIDEAHEHHRQELKQQEEQL
jgi:septal ring factor EnvC (AmiA/AmiB activator)